MEYSGTVIVVSHDRAFLNNVVTSTLVFEGEGRVQEYAGGYDDWLRQSSVHQEKFPPVKEEKKKRVKSKSTGPRKLTFKETRELEELPGRIETLEQEKKLLYDAMTDESFYKDDGNDVAKANARLGELEKLQKDAHGSREELEVLPEEYEKR